METLDTKLDVQSSTRECASLMHFTLKKNSKVNRDKLYSVSIDVGNFSNVMPKYFKSITINKSIGNEIFVDEKIYFLCSLLDVKTKHVIIHPRIHEVHILSGPLQGSSFVELYDETLDGTNVVIDVLIKFNGVSKLFLPFGFLIKRQMAKVRDEFLDLAEKIVFDLKE
jgi:hypothetical protein